MNDSLIMHQAKVGISDPSSQRCVPGDPIALAPILQRARAAWVDLKVSDEIFVPYVMERLGEEGMVGLENLHAGDLYLACACLRQVPGALETFESNLLSRVPLYVARLGLSVDQLDELQQALREKLFMGQGEGGPRIADYAGRGPLEGWLRVVAVRSALNTLRQRPAGLPLDEVAAAQWLGERDAELAHVQERYRKDFQDAVRDALAGLSSEQRNLLRLYFVSGLSLEKIGVMFQLSRATATRRLAATQEALQAAVQRLLKERLSLSLGEVESLGAVLCSGLELSLARILSTSER